MSQTINCPVCTNTIIVPEAKIDIINGALNSVAIYHHETGVDCQCGAYLVPIVGHATMQISYRPMVKPTEAPMIVVPQSAMTQ